jgi:glucosamine 6-phosphate synthetase-like amidotransferase/phosphosugar isomerase protein
MCGIFGFVDIENELTSDQKNRLLRNLAISAQSRGSDASGYAYLDPSDSISIYKKATPARKLLFEVGGSQLVIGHTRYATMGDPRCDSQAHPFQSMDLNYALTHNGVGLLDFLKLSKEYALEAQIDSEGMLRFLEKVGFHAAGLNEFYRQWDDSGFAIATIDASKKCLILFRNEMNPLVLARTTEGVLVYGSTTGIVITGCLTAGLEVVSMTNLEPGIRYEYGLDGKEKEEMIPSYDAPTYQVGAE